MNVGKGIMIGLAVAIVAVAGQFARAEGGQPSRQTMEQMGLGGIVVMSDDEAATVRGKGFMGSNGAHSSVQVSGNSFATINTPFGGAHSENAYAARGKHEADGANGSIAGVIVISSNGGKKGGSGGMGGYPGGTVRKPSGGMGGYPGGGMGGGMGGYPGGGGGTSVHIVAVFAGGFSVGHAH